MGLIRGSIEFIQRFEWRKRYDLRWFVGTSEKHPDMAMTQSLEALSKYEEENTSDTLQEEIDIIVFEAIEKIDLGSIEPLDKLTKKGLNNQG